MVKISIGTALKTLEKKWRDDNTETICFSNSMALEAVKNILKECVHDGWINAREVGLYVEMYENLINAGLWDDDDGEALEAIWIKRDIVNRTEILYRDDNSEMDAEFRDAFEKVVKDWQNGERGMCFNGRAPVEAVSDDGSMVLTRI